MTYAIDLVPVDTRGRSGSKRDWRTLLSTEPPERFVGFGTPVLAPCRGTVVRVHDGEPDHEARRSQLALVPYMLSQRGRLRQGAAGLAGNHVVLELEDGGGYVALVHLRRDSIDSIEVRRGRRCEADRPSPRATTRATRPNRTSTCRSWTEPTPWRQLASLWSSSGSSSTAAARPAWSSPDYPPRVPSSSRQGEKGLRLAAGARHGPVPFRHPQRRSRAEVASSGSRLVSQRDRTVICVGLAVSGLAFGAAMIVTRTIPSTFTRFAVGLSFAASVPVADRFVGRHLRAVPRQGKRW